MAKSDQNYFEYTVQERERNEFAALAGIFDISKCNNDKIIKLFEITRILTGQMLWK